jgi:hypothetical protein
MPGVVEVYLRYCALYLHVIRLLRNMVLMCIMWSFLCVAVTYTQLIFSVGHSELMASICTEVLLITSSCEEGDPHVGL